MDFFTAVKNRRSVRKFIDKPVDEEILWQAFSTAVLAPNSSNTQTWDFYWVRSSEKKQKLVELCFSQSAARTAQELVVIVADPKLWKRSQPELIKWVESVHAPKSVILYYRKLIPLTYRWGFLNSLGLLKWIAFSLAGLFRPVPRGPHSKSEAQLVSVKSAALAAENFVLSLSARGVSSCMMEGFDEVRVKKLLGLPRSARVVMVVGIGYPAERGTWGPQMRLPLEQTVHRV